MFVNDLLRSARVKTNLVDCKTHYTQFGYIKMKELSESMKGCMPDLNYKIDIDKFIMNFWGVPFSSVEDVLKNYAETGRADGNLPRGGITDNDEAGQNGTTPVEIAALENDPEDEEDMYAHSSFYPRC